MPQKGVGIDLKQQLDLTSKSKASAKGFERLPACFAHLAPVPDSQVPVGPYGGEQVALCTEAATNRRPNLRQCSAQKM